MTSAEGAGVTARIELGFSTKLRKSARNGALSRAGQGRAAESPEPVVIGVGTIMSEYAMAENTNIFRPHWCVRGCSPVLGSISNFKTIMHLAGNDSKVLGMEG